MREDGRELRSNLLQSFCQVRGQRLYKPGEATDGYTMQWRKSEERLEKRRMPTKPKKVYTVEITSHAWMEGLYNSRMINRRTHQPSDLARNRGHAKRRLELSKESEPWHRGRNSAEQNHVRPNGRLGLASARSQEESSGGAAGFLGNYRGRFHMKSRAQYFWNL